MKNIFFFLLLLGFITPGFSQRKANVGIFAGTSYYLGDINPNTHFYNPKLSYGLIYRYNLNKFFALRANGYYSSLSGNDLDFPDLYHPGDRYYFPAVFSTSLIDANAQFEMNFFPYLPNTKKWDITPYIAGGLGYSIIISSNSSDADSPSATSHFTLPFGIGMKVTLSEKISAGMEWSFRKTSNDMVDGLENETGSGSVIHNNDWYSFAGIFITYKFFNFAVDCPTYE